jgi:predicted restriction endonuclease
MIEKVYSIFLRSQHNFCNYECFKEYLKKHRIVTENITDSAEYKEWRKKVYFRDNYKCKMPGCGSNSKQIAAHHIYPKKQFPEKQFDISNGITLCKKCHEKTFGKEALFIDALVRVVQKMND